MVSGRIRPLYNGEGLESTSFADEKGQVQSLAFPGKGSQVESVVKDFSPILGLLPFRMENSGQEGTDKSCLVLSICLWQ